MALPIWWMRKLRSGEVGNTASTPQPLECKVYGICFRSPIRHRQPKLPLAARCEHSITSGEEDHVQQFRSPAPYLETIFHSDSSCLQAQHTSGSPSLPLDV